MFTDDFSDIAIPGDQISTSANGFTVVACLKFDGTVSDPRDVDEGLTKDQIRAWEEDRWYYGGLVLAVYRNGVLLDENAASLWVIEVNLGADNAHLVDVANELLPEALARGREVLNALLQSVTEETN